jgi:5'-phosphate synthase pdxT subunit
VTGAYGHAGRGDPKEGRATLRVGILAVQGAVSEHEAMLARLGVEVRQVRRPEHLEGLEGLVIPGGESTTIGMLMQEYGLIDALADGHLPIFGTCAGAIVLAKEIAGSAQPRLGLVDVRIVRNAFGRQRESFETDLEVAGVGRVHAVFIRAPYVDRVGEGVDVLAWLDGKAVLWRQGPFLASSFHPELTDDTRIHRYFVEEVIPSRNLVSR